MTVRIDLARVARNARDVRQQVGVPVLAVVKADAYGLGAAEVIGAIDAAVDGYCFFSLGEALAADFRSRTNKSAITLGPPGGVDPLVYRRHNVRPAVATVRDAWLLRASDPILAVDTGQQRFACPPHDVEAALREGGCRAAMTHASRPEQVSQFMELVGGRGLTLHAAGSSLLAEPAARLDAVRPGLALYRRAVRVSARLVDVRDSTGPAGYGGFVVPRHGVILCGYSHGLRPGPCLVGGRTSRVLEVGMQSAFVECGPADRVGEEVVLLGDDVTEDAVAAAWGTSPHVPLVQLTGAGERQYAGG